MMRILVFGVEEKSHRTIDHMIKTFYEEPDIHFMEGSDSAEDADLVLDFHYSIEESPVFCFGLKLAFHNTVRRYQEEVIASEGQSEEERNRIRKRALSRVLLRALEDFTGLEQPWGVLTGIRPTKLLHQSKKNGLNLKEAHRELRETVRVRQEKIDLLQSIVDRQLQVIPDLYELQDEVSIYIGIPFCPTKCAYCTFPAYDINGRQGSVNSFLGGLHYEMRRIGQWLKQHQIKVTTVYFGGGTPTSITAAEMDLLYEELYSSFPMDQVREVTVEAGRPDTIEPDKLRVLNKWGIDRISINPQSYTADTLQAIGRHHTVEETIEKFWLAREYGMNNINMDLIIGLPGEGIEHFRHTLSQTEKLMPESLTVHTLSFKRASEMTQNKEKYKVAGREEIAAMMKLAEEWTREHSYAPYYLYRQKNILGNLENVGYALPGRESLYNILIMEEVQTIIGLGCGAASKWVHPATGEISRFANPKEPKAYNDHYQKYTEDKIAILKELYQTKTIPAGM